MSNLIKPQNFRCGNSETKIIDYNLAISEKIAKIQNEIQNVENIRNDEEFIEGLQAQQVDKLISDETPEELQKQADEIVQQANQDAQAIINRAKEEAEILKQESIDAGMKQGYEEGHTNAMKEFEELKKNIEKQKIELQQEYEEQVNKIEPMLVDTILKVFEKVTYVLGEDDKELVLNLVNNVLTKSEVSKEFLIKVSGDDYEFLANNRERIYGAVSKQVQIEIVEEATLKKNQCIIESDSGIYDCSLDVQMNNLIRTIKTLSCMVD